MLVEHALLSCVPSVFGFCLVWGRLEKVRRAIEQRDPARLRRLAECFRDDAKTQRSRIFPPWDDGPKPPTVSSASPLVPVEAAP